MTAMFDDQAMHVAYIVDEVKQRGKRVAEVTAQAEEQWVAEIVALAGTGAAEFLEQCTPGYYNREGRGTQGNMQNSPYARGINAFNALLQKWREQGDMEGMEVR